MNVESLEESQNVCHTSASRKQRRILFVTRCFEYGGAERYLLQLIERLCGPEVHVTVICFIENFFSARLKPELADYVDITVAEEPTKWRWIALLAKSRPDVVVFNSGSLWIFPWYAPIAARLAGASRSVFVAHLPPPANGERRHWLTGIKLTAPLWNATICVSNEIRNYLINDFRFPPKRVRTVLNGVSLPDFGSTVVVRPNLKGRLAISEEEFLIVCTARLTDQKGIDILLKAMAQVLSRGVQCKCIIVGEGPERQELETLMQSLGLGEHVFFEGFRTDVRPYLRAADAFVLTSVREGLPLSLLEAMACGLACVVTRVGANAEVIDTNVDGLLVNAGSPSEVADAIVYLVRNPQQRAAMGRNARARVETAFDLEKKMAEVRGIILGPSASPVRATHELQLRSVE